MAKLHDVRFPGEPLRYRKARDQLLREERELRKQVETVAAKRRKLPLGGPVPEDYVFDEGAPDLADTTTVRQVRLSELFTRPGASLVLYSFMYGPEMDHACPMCTSILDSLDGTAPHATQRINFAVVAKSPLARIRAYARSRAWTNLRLLSSAGNTYNRDYHGETPDGAQMPSLNVFVRKNRKIFHSYNTELLWLRPPKGQNARHVDLIWPLWNLFDFTPEGRGTTWFPKTQY